MSPHIDGRVTPAAVDALVDEGFASTRSEAMAMLADMGEPALTDPDDVLEAKWALETRLAALAKAEAEAREAGDTALARMHTDAHERAYHEWAELDEWLREHTEAGS